MHKVTTDSHPLGEWTLHKEFGAYHPSTQEDLTQGAAIRNEMLTYSINRAEKD